MNWNNRLRLNMDIISIEKREGIIRGIRMITCKFDDKWKCSFAKMDDERKFGKRVFFFFFSAKVQSESSESERNESFNEKHCTRRPYTLFDTFVTRPFLRYNKHLDTFNNK